MIHAWVGPEEEDSKDLYLALNIIILIPRRTTQHNVDLNTFYPIYIRTLKPLDQSSRHSLIARSKPDLSLYQQQGTYQQGGIVGTLVMATRPCSAPYSILSVYIVAFIIKLFLSRTINSL